MFLLQLGRRVYFIVQFTNPQEISWDRNSRQEQNQLTGGTLRTSLLLNTARDHLPRDGTAYSGLGWTLPLINQ